MPQMMPINWLISFFFFLSVFILFNMMNYYIYNPKLTPMFNNKLKNLKNLTWKW